VKYNEVLSFLLFISGYAIGRIDSIANFFKKSKKCDSFIDDIKQSEKQLHAKKKMIIDDSKFVTKVSTSSFEKNGDLGVNSEVSDNIENETAKLAKLKKKKG
jgi:hypothetical protein